MMGATAIEFGIVAFDVLFLSSLRAMALILPVWLALSLMRPRRPALEHGAWTAALCGNAPVAGAGLIRQAAGNLLKCDCRDDAFRPGDAGMAGSSRFPLDDRYRFFR